MKKIFCLMIAFMLLIFCAAAEEAAADTAEENVLVATLRDEKIYMSDVEAYAYQLYSSGLISSYTDYATALEYLLKYNALPAVMMKEMGAETVLGEEAYLQAVEDAKVGYEAELKSYVEYFYGTDLTEEEFSGLYKEVENMYIEAGFGVDAYIEEYVTGEAFAKFFMEQTFEISDEEIEETFIEFAESDKELFGNDIEMYEYYTSYMGYQPLYTPEGFRGITHILLTADEALLDAYSAAKETGDEAAIEKAENDVIESLRETIDLIYKSLEGGVEFESLIAEFGGDPGMQDEQNLANGYAVHKNSSTYVQEFTDGSFSEKMVKVGDVSDPVVTAYGVHILYYLRDVPSGYVELDDMLKEDIRSYLTGMKQDELLDKWLQDYGVEYAAEYASLIG